MASSSSTFPNNTLVSSSSSTTSSLEDKVNYIFITSHDLYELSVFQYRGTECLEDYEYGMDYYPLRVGYHFPDREHREALFTQRLPQDVEDDLRELSSFLKKIPCKLVLIESIGLVGSVISEEPISPQCKIEWCHNTLKSYRLSYDTYGIRVSEEHLKKWGLIGEYGFLNYLKAAKSLGSNLDNLIHDEEFQRGPIPYVCNRLTCERARNPLHAILQDEEWMLGKSKSNFWWCLPPENNGGSSIEKIRNSLAFEKIYASFRDILSSVVTSNATIAKKEPRKGLKNKKKLFVENPNEDKSENASTILQSKTNDLRSNIDSLNSKIKSLNETINKWQSLESLEEKVAECKAKCYPENNLQLHIRKLDNTLEQFKKRRLEYKSAEIENDINILLERGRHATSDVAFNDISARYTETLEKVRLFEIQLKEAYLKLEDAIHQANQDILRHRSRNEVRTKANYNNTPSLFAHSNSILQKETKETPAQATQQELTSTVSMPRQNRKERRKIAREGKNAAEGRLAQQRKELDRKNALIQREEEYQGLKANDFMQEQGENKKQHKKLSKRQPSDPPRIYTPNAHVNVNLSFPVAMATPIPAQGNVIQQNLDLSQIEGTLSNVVPELTPEGVVRGGQAFFMNNNAQVKIAPKKGRQNKGSKSNLRN